MYRLLYVCVFASIESHNTINMQLGKMFSTLTILNLYHLFLVIKSLLQTKSTQRFIIYTLYLKEENSSSMNRISVTLAIVLK